MAIQTINPSTGKTVKTFSAMGRRVIEVKLATAAVAFKYWRNVTVNKRSILMKKVAVHLKKNAENMEL